MCARNQPEKLRVHAVLALHFSLVVFSFSRCASESTPTKSRKGPRPSPERAPDQVPKGPPTKSRKGPRPCESTPDSDLNEAKLCPIWPSVLLVFLNLQCRASFSLLPLQHALPFWCQQTESTHHFVKSLTFRRPAFLFCNFEFCDCLSWPLTSKRVAMV